MNKYETSDPNNKWYPLPYDYPELTSEGQKQARIATLCNQTTPMKMVEAWSLFRRLYLKPTPEGFFYDSFKESPPFHYELIYDCGMYSRNALAAPRGFAKSTIIGLELPALLLLTRKYFKIVMGLSTDKLVAGRFEKFMTLFSENSLIIDDFGILKPLRGEGMWNHHHIHLNNGSEIEGFSVGGRKRGARPNLFILDDPEYDPESSSRSAALLQIDKFENVLFRQIIPMLRKGSGIIWIGTILNSRCYLHYACYEEDPRFKSWNRKVYASGLAEGASLWPDEWSIANLEARRLEIGSAAFAAEYDNTPASAQDRLLVIDPIKNEYTLQADGQAISTITPLSGEGIITWNEKDPQTGEFQPQTMVQKDLYAKLFRVVLFDYGEGLSPHHDYSCALVLGFDNRNNLWVLDGWMGRAKRPKLLHTIYELGSKWHVKVIGLESVALQGNLPDAMEEYLSTYNPDPDRWHPHIMGIKYPPNVSKADRISGLEWRFLPGRIKYPHHLKDKWPFKALYAQTEDFTEDLALLRFDDAIDTVSMNQYVVHTKGNRTTAPPIPPTIVEMVAQGITTLGGVPIVSGLRTETMSEDLIKALLDKHLVQAYNTQCEQEQENKRIHNSTRPYHPRNRSNINKTRLLRRKKGQLYDRLKHPTAARANNNYNNSPGYGNY